MTTNEITTIKITPAEGMWLTQATINESEERVFSESVFCPIGQEDKWHEVTNTYKQEWEQAHPQPDAPPTD